MATPLIKIDQVDAVAGVAGVSRDDLVLNKVVTFSVTNFPVEATYLWSIISKPEGEVATLSSTTAAAPTYTPTRRGSVGVEVVVNGINYSFDLDPVTGLRVSTQGAFAVKQADGTRIPFNGETAQFSAEGYHPAVSQTMALRSRGYLKAGNPLGGLVAELPGETITLLPGTHTLGAVTADDPVLDDPTATIKFMQGAVLVVSATRTIDCRLDFSEGGKIRPSSAAVPLTLTGPINLPANHHAFDVSLGGVFQIRPAAIDRLTPYNFGAKGDDATYDDVALRAWLTACGWSVAASGGILPSLPAGNFLFGSLVDAGENGEFVALKITAELLGIVGAGERISRLHFKPTSVTAGTYVGVQFQGASGQGFSNAICGVGFSAGNSFNYQVKVALDLHDTRDFIAEQIEVVNWTDDARRSVGIRVRGRDHTRIQQVRVSASLPILIDYNSDETLGRDANGYPLGFRDILKDQDHCVIRDAALVCTGSVDNIWKACVLVKAGGAVRNLSLEGSIALVGGGVVWVDRHDSAPDTVESVSAGADTLTLTGHLYQTGDQVSISNVGGALPGGLSALPTWWHVIKIDANTIKLATTAQNAVDGDAVDITSAGTGTHTISGAAFRGAQQEPRRVSNQCSLGHTRVEGITWSGPDTFAVRIEKHNNAPLRELVLGDCFLGAGSDARFAINVGGSQTTGAAWSGVRAYNVERVAIGAGARYAGVGVPLDVDTDAHVEVHANASLVPADNKRYVPEHESHWDLLDIARPRSFWINDKASGTIDDEQSVALDYDLDAAGSVGYQQLVAGWSGFWTQFTAEAANTKFRLNSTDAELNPNLHSVAAWEIIKVTAATADRQICNLGNGNTAAGANGPLLRIGATGKLEIRLNGVSNFGGLSYLDGQAFAYFFAYNRTAQKVKCWTRKEDGTGEVFEGTWVSAVGDSADKGFGSATASFTSYAGYSRARAWFLDDAAEQDGFTVLRKLGWYSTADKTAVSTTSLLAPDSLPIRMPHGVYVLEVKDWNVQIATDGPSSVKLPATDLEWVKSRLPVPDAWWLNQSAASPTPNESEDSRFDLVASGAVEYQQALAGWVGSFIKLTETASESLQLDTSEFNPATGSVAALCYARIGTVGGNRMLTALGTSDVSVGGGGQQVRFNSGGNATVRANGTEVTGTYVYEGDGLEHAFLLVYNATRHTIRLITDQETIEGVYAATIANATTKGFGGASGQTPPECWIRYGAWWYSTKAEEIDALGRNSLARLGWYEESPQEASFSPGGIDRLPLSRTSADVLLVGAGGCRSANNLMDLRVTTSLNADRTATGAGGLRSGASWSASTWYYIHLIGDTTQSNGTAAFIDTTAVPTLPAGYDSYKLIGMWKSDAAGTPAWRFLSQRGNSKTRRYYWDEARSVVQVLTDGSATSFTDVDLSAWVPPGCDLAIVMPALAVPVTTGNAADVLQLRTNGANSSDGPWKFGPGVTGSAAANKVCFAPVEIPTDANRVIEYLVSDADDDADLWVIGFDHEI